MKTLFSDYTLKTSQKALDPRRAMIKAIAKEFNISARSIYFKTNQTLTDKEIEDVYNEARKWDKNPGALFWKLLKAKCTEVKAKL